MELLIIVVIVLVLGYLASWLFPADTNLKSEWTYWGWRETRKTLGMEKLGVEKLTAMTTMEANP